MTIYVGNIAYNMSEQELADVFKTYGNVISVKIITDKYSGRSRGFGFVEMEKDDEGQQAIQELNGKEVKGRNLRVNKANIQKEAVK